jgi:hypothetical protein
LASRIVQQKNALVGLNHHRHAAHQAPQRLLEFLRRWQTVTTRINRK